MSRVISMEEARGVVAALMFGIVVYMLTDSWSAWRGLWWLTLLSTLASQHPMPEVERKRWERASAYRAQWHRKRVLIDDIRARGRAGALRPSHLKVT